MTMADESTLVSEARTLESYMMQLEGMVEESPDLKKLSDAQGGWFRAVIIALELFQQPRNLEQLWVWSRLLWAFGRRDTWRANEGFECMIGLHANAIAWHKKLIDLRKELDSRSWFQFASRARLEAAIDEAEEQLELSYRKLGHQLDTLLVNDNTWSDRSEFLAFKGRR